MQAIQFESTAHIASCSILALIGITVIDVCLTVGTSVPWVACTGVHGNEVLKQDSQHTVLNYKWELQSSTSHTDTKFHIPSIPS